MDLTILIPIVVVAVIAFVIYKKKSALSSGDSVGGVGGGKPNEVGNTQEK